MNPTLLADLATDTAVSHMVWGAWMWLPGLVTALLVGAALVWFVRRTNLGARCAVDNIAEAPARHQPSRPAPADRRVAEDIIAQGYARGELTIEEYRERRKALR